MINRLGNIYIKFQKINQIYILFLRTLFILDILIKITKYKTMIN